MGKIENFDSSDNKLPKPTQVFRPTRIDNKQSPFGQKAYDNLVTALNTYGIAETLKKMRRNQEVIPSNETTITVFMQNEMYTYEEMCQALDYRNTKITQYREDGMEPDEAENAVKEDYERKGKAELYKAAIEWQRDPQQSHHEDMDIDTERYVTRTRNNPESSAVTTQQESSNLSLVVDSPTTKADIDHMLGENEFNTLSNLHSAMTSIKLLGKTRYNLKDEDIEEAKALIKEINMVQQYIKPHLSYKPKYIKYKLDDIKKAIETLHDRLPNLQKVLVATGNKRRRPIDKFLEKLKIGNRTSSKAQEVPQYLGDESTQLDQQDSTSYQTDSQRQSLQQSYGEPLEQQERTDPISTLVRNIRTKYSDIEQLHDKLMIMLEGRDLMDDVKLRKAIKYTEKLIRELTRACSMFMKESKEEKGNAQAKIENAWENIQLEANTNRNILYVLYSLEGTGGDHPFSIDNQDSSHDQYSQQQDSNEDEHTWGPWLRKSKGPLASFLRDIKGFRTGQDAFEFAVKDPKFRSRCDNEQTRYSHFGDAKQGKDKASAHLASDKDFTPETDMQESKITGGIDKSFTLEQRKMLYLMSIPRETIRFLKDKVTMYKNNPSTYYDSRRQTFQEIRIACSRIEIGCKYVETKGSARSKMIKEFGYVKDEEGAILDAITLKEKVDDLSKKFEEKIPNAIVEAINKIKECYQNAGLDETDSTHA